MNPGAAAPGSAAESTKFCRLISGSFGLQIHPSRASRGKTAGRLKAMVKIRLRREGTKDRPYYRVVVADSRARKDGRFIEIVGNYDPLKDGDNYRIDLEKIEGWLAKGAQPSDTVRSIIKKARAAAKA